jgi:hypothetical protein
MNVASAVRPPLPRRGHGAKKKPGRSPDKGPCKINFAFWRRSFAGWRGANEAHIHRKFLSAPSAPACRSSGAARPRRFNCPSGSVRPPPVQSSAPPPWPSADSGPWTRRSSEPPPGLDRPEEQPPKPQTPDKMGLRAEKCGKVRKKNKKKPGSAKAQTTSTHTANSTSLHQLWNPSRAGAAQPARRLKDI